MVEPFNTMNVWLNKIQDDPEIGVLSLLRQLGIENSIHIIYTPNKLNIEKIGDQFTEEAVALFQEERNIRKLSRIIEEKKEQFNIIIMKTSYTGYNINAILGDEIKDIILVHYDKRKFTVRKLQEIIKFAFLALKMSGRLLTLENTIKIYHSERNVIIPRPSLTISEVPLNFIQDSVPAVFNSILNEDVGPMVVCSFPEYLVNAEYQILGVNVFSGVDSEILAELGHIFTSTQIKRPALGELINIIFTIANSKARGNFEVHALSVLIDQEFVNLAKSTLYQIKASLFSGVEKIRQYFNRENIDIIVEYPKIDEIIIADINEIILQVRKEVAISFAEMLSKEDVLNW